MAANAGKNNLVDQNTPPSIASGCIYLYCLENKLSFNKKDISRVCLISEVTINKCYKKLYDNIDKLF
jgi:transcription initiation factor TFIIIB Brf1 subunit/transcription initiation factor TFIIB